MKSVLFLILFFFSAFYSFSQEAVFEFKQEVQEYIVGDDIYELDIELIGASGGNSVWENKHLDQYEVGKGGKLRCKLPVHPGEKIFVFVGGKGEDAQGSEPGKGGFNGGGDGASSAPYGPYCGGGGGGASDIRIGGLDISNRILIAGGGGGAAANHPYGGDHGGHGGYLVAANGMVKNKIEHSASGKGGSFEKGGEGGFWEGYLKAQNGIIGKGGDAATKTSGGGGGGGYYGGGGGSWAGGGGGSSYASQDAKQKKHEQGVNEGHGKVIIYSSCQKPKLISALPPKICEGDKFVIHAKASEGSQLFWNDSIVNGEAFYPPLGRTSYLSKSNNIKDCPLMVEINVVAKPMVTATTIKSVLCDGETTILYGHGADNYFWNKGVENGKPFIPKSPKEAYIVEGNNGLSSCSDKDTIVIRTNKIDIQTETEYDPLTGLGTIRFKQNNFASHPLSYSVNGQKINNSYIENLEEGTYTVSLKDAIGCWGKRTVAIKTPLLTKNSESENIHLKAETDVDQSYVTISYKGNFEFQIEDKDENVVINGTAFESTKVNITKLKAGKYTVSLIYKEVKEQVSFIKR